MLYGGIPMCAALESLRVAREQDAQEGSSPQIQRIIDGYRADRFGQDEVRLAEAILGVHISIERDSLPSCTPILINDSSQVILTLNEYCMTRDGHIDGKWPHERMRWSFATEEQVRAAYKE